MFCKAKSAKKQTFFCVTILHHFQTKMLQSETASFHFFPQEFWILKNIGHPTSGSGGKKTFIRYLKNEHTDKQTDRQADISTYRKHRPRDRQGQTGTDRDRQGQVGTSMDRQGQTGTSRDKQKQKENVPVCPCLSLLVPALSQALTGIIGK